MTSKEFFIKMMEDELPRFERFVNAVPKDKIDYVHPDDPKGSSAIKVLAGMGGSASTFAGLLKEGTVDFSAVDWAKFSSFDSARDALVGGLRESIEVAKEISDDVWESKAQMLMGEKVEWETEKPIMMMGLLMDLVHHRGQLSTYIRPMGGQVPSIYGPSGDTQ